MLERIIIISLIITAIHVSMWEGMIFQSLREWLDGVFDIFHVPVLATPLYDCLICMGGVWTLVLYPVLYGWSWDVLVAVPAVIGLNTIVSVIIRKIHDYE